MVEMMSEIMAELLHEMPDMERLEVAALLNWMVRREMELAAMAENPELSGGELQLTVSAQMLSQELPPRYASPEDVIIHKLRYYQMGESVKHVRDILGILRNQKDKIDRDYIRHWVSEMGLQVEWTMILEKEKEWIQEDIS